MKNINGHSDEDEERLEEICDMSDEQILKEVEMLFAVYARNNSPKVAVLAAESVIFALKQIPNQSSN